MYECFLVRAMRARAYLHVAKVRLQYLASPRPPTIKNAAIPQNNSGHAHRIYYKML